jgi:hypothetical protein
MCVSMTKWVHGRTDFEGVDGGAPTWAIARSRIVRADGGFYGIGRERIELTSPQ